MAPQPLQVAANGIDTEASYPYTSGNGTAPACAAKQHAKAKVQATGHVLLNASEVYIAAFVAKFGPVSVALDDMPLLWFPYAGGIMRGCCNRAAAHAVLIVGYGTDGGVDYWIIKVPRLP